MPWPTRIADADRAADPWRGGVGDAFRVPKPIAKIGALAEDKAEPVIPDDIDKGEKPFIRPFMIDMADDHYALDIARARRTARLAAAPLDPHDAADHRRRAEERSGWLVREERAHAAGLAERRPTSAARTPRTSARATRRWCATNMRASSGRISPMRRLGTWLIISPATMGYADSWLGWSDMASGIVLFALGLLSLSWRLALVRYAAAAVRALDPVRAARVLDAVARPPISTERWSARSSWRWRCASGPSRA